MRVNRLMETGKRLFSGIIFDLDGTLTAPAIDFPKMRNRLGITGNILEHVRSLTGEERIVAEKIIKEVETEALHNLQLQANCTEILSTIYQHKIPMAIITKNTKDGVEAFLRVLHKSNPDVKFDPILTRENDEKYCKPRPDGVRWICDQWGLSYDTVLVVGDHEDDLIAGTGAGCASCLLECLSPNNIHFTPKANYTIKDLLELDQYILKSL